MNSFRPPGPLPVWAILVLQLLFSACTLQVEKLEPYGINDQFFVASPKIGVWQDSVFRFCCNGTIATHRSLLDKGDYTILLNSMGTQAYQTYPLIKVRVNDSLLKAIKLDGAFTTYRVPFSLQKKDSVDVSVVFDQDGADDKGNDRDVLIKSIRVRPSTFEDTIFSKAINDQQFDYTPGAGYWQGPIFRFCCNGRLSTPRSLLEQGRYAILIRGKGTPAYETYPLIRVRLNDSLLQDVRLSNDLTTYRIPFLVSKPDSVTVSVSFDQDGADNKGNDRDVLIQSIYVLPAGE